MELGMIGLGRTGANMVRRPMRNGHRCIVCDVQRDAATPLFKEKAAGPEGGA